MIDTFLEPMSRATSTLLERPVLNDGEFLFVGLDRKARKFRVELKRLKRAGVEVRDVDMGETTVQTISRPTRTLRVNDEEWVEDWRPISASAVEFFSDRFPESTWLGKKSPKLKYSWELATTDITALILYHCWPKDRLFFRNSESGDIFYALVRRFFAQNARAAMIARFKQAQTALLDRYFADEITLDELNAELEAVVPELPADWLEHPDPKRRLSPYQKVAVLSALGADGFALHMDRGTGKTASAIQVVSMEAMRKRRDDGGMFRCLVVVPPQVVDNWQREIGKFATVKCKSVIVRSHEVGRIRLVAMGVKDEPEYAAGICIIPYDSMVGSVEALRRVPWDRVIYDESHFFKSHTTNRFSAVEQLRDVAGRRLNLTGTPIGNYYWDLWSQLEALGEGLSGFLGFKNFRKFYGVYEKEDGIHGVEKLVGLRNCALIQERLARLTFAVTKREALPFLPEKAYDQYTVAMTARQAEIYQKVAADLAVEAEDKLNKKSDSLTINHILTRLLRLSQITSGFVTWDAKVDPETGDVLAPKRVEQVGIVNPKIDAVVEMMRDEDPDCKVIIWACWVEDIHAIHERLQREGFKGGTYFGGTAHDERQPNVDAFGNGDVPSDPEFRYLVCNAQTAGEGLNLLGYGTDGAKTYAGHEIFFSQNWSAILRQQAEDRAHRRGTRTVVRITDLVCPGTIDEDIRDRVQERREQAATLQDVRAILKSVLDNFNPIIAGYGNAV